MPGAAKITELPGIRKQFGFIIFTSLHDMCVLNTLPVPDIDSNLKIVINTRYTYEEALAMKDYFSRKVCVITGAASGIGLQLSKPIN